MIKFFRRIRQKLLTDGKLSKYLIYAIGEILLVVIGILIALQINNWNEGRKARLQEIKLLTQLNSDLQSNLEEVKHIIGGEVANHITYGVTLRAEAKDSILHYLEDAEKHKEDLKLYLHMLPLKGIFNRANTAYKSIEAGGIDILSNDSLRTLVTEKYEHRLHNIYVRENLEYEIITNRLKPILQETLIPTSVSSKLHPPAFYKMFGNKTVLNYPKDPLTLKEDSRFINTLTELQEITLARKARLELTMRELKVLIQEVAAEIERLKIG